MTVYFQGIGYTDEPLNVHDCPAQVRSMVSLWTPNLQVLHIELTKRLHGKPAPLKFQGIGELRERVWNLLLEFHGLVNVKKNRARFDSFGDMVVTVARAAQAVGRYGPVPDAPDSFDTDTEAHRWVQNNREKGFDYRVIITRTGI